MSASQFLSCFRLNSQKAPLFPINCQTVSLPTSKSLPTGMVERPWKVADARLVLEDGSVWWAKSFGASGTQVGEVVFNTSLTGRGIDTTISDGEGVKIVLDDGVYSTLPLCPQLTRAGFATPRDASTITI
ncbi:hypothetical protein OROMI_004845 [Orobanche minor]